MTGLVVLFLLFDGVTKLAMERHVVEATKEIGYPVDVIPALGIICLVSTILYVVPRTAVLGAILLTGFLGGAIASKVRIEDPLFSSTLFGVYFAFLSGADSIFATTGCARSCPGGARSGYRARHCVDDGG